MEDIHSELSAIRETETPPDLRSGILGKVYNKVSLLSAQTAYRQQSCLILWLLGSLAHELKVPGCL